MWVYPQEIDETLADSSSIASEDFANDGLILIPEEIDEVPDVSIAAAEPSVEDEFPETNEPPVLLGDTDPSVSVIPSPPLVAVSPVVVPPLSSEEIYETPDSSIAVMEPDIVEDNFPETSEPPVLLGDDDPSVAVIPSQPVSVSSVPPLSSDEIYETPNSSIAVMEPGMAEEDFPETSTPPVLLGSEDPSVSVIPSSLPASSSSLPPSSSVEETYESPGSNIAVVEPGITEDEFPEETLPSEQTQDLDSNKTETPVVSSVEIPQAGTEPESYIPETETELAFVPTSDRPPEGSNYNLPSGSEIGSVSASSSVGSAPVINPRNRGFSIPEISRLEPGAYYVQLGAFSESDSVEQVASDVGSAYPLKVQSSGSSAKPLYKVLLGPVNIGEGSALLQRFKTRGYSDSFIVPNPRY
jgi:hypothetical protein